MKITADFDPCSLESFGVHHESALLPPAPPLPVRAYSIVDALDRVWPDFEDEMRSERDLQRECAQQWEKKCPCNQEDRTSTCRSYAAWVITHIMDRETPRIITWRDCPYVIGKDLSEIIFDELGNIREGVPRSWENNASPQDFFILFWHCWTVLVPSGKANLRDLSAIFEVMCRLTSQAQLTSYAPANIRTYVDHGREECIQTLQSDGNLQRTVRLLRHDNNAKQARQVICFLEHKLLAEPPHRALQYFHQLKRQCQLFDLTTLTVWEMAHVLNSLIRSLDSFLDLAKKQPDEKAINCEHDSTCAIAEELLMLRFQALDFHQATLNNSFFECTWGMMDTNRLKILCWWLFTKVCEPDPQVPGEGEVCVEVTRRVYEELNEERGFEKFCAFCFYYLSWAPRPVDVLFGHYICVSLCYLAGTPEREVHIHKRLTEALVNKI